MNESSPNTVKCRMRWVALITCGVILAIFLAAVSCYPVSWRTMQNESAFEWTDVTEIDLNTAGAEQLCLLPGIGPEKAAAIIAYRETYGGFLSLEEVLEVPGIGEATLAGWQGMAVVR